MNGLLKRIMVQMMLAWLWSGLAVLVPVLSQKYIKSFDDQAARLEKQRAEKKEEKKVTEKKSKKKEREERLEEKRLQKKEAQEVIIFADSIEELKKKIDDYNYTFKADMVKSETEKYLGTVIDFKG